jgi:putative transposase
VKGIEVYFKEAIKEVREFFPDWFIEEIGTDEDHVHLYMVIPPKYAVSKVVEVMKSISSKRMKEKFPHFLKKVYWDGGGIWSRGFFVSTAGINEDVIRKYVKYQGQEDSSQTKFEW